MTRRLLALLLLLPLALSCGSLRTRRHGPPPAAFTLAAPAARARLLPGLPASFTLVLTAEPGFQGRVELAAPIPDKDLGASFQPAQVELASGQSAQVTLTLAAREDAAPGPRSLSLLASSGDLSAGAVLDLDIPAASFFTVITYKGPDPSNFAFLVYRDGDGPWTPVPGRQGTYRLPVTDPAGRFGVFYGDPCVFAGGATQWLVNGFFESISESQILQAFFLCNPQSGPPPDQYALSGALAGAGQDTSLISGNSGIWAFPPGARDYDLQLYKGSSDLLAGRYPSTADYLPTRFIAERGRQVQGPLTRDFDFATQGVDAPPVQPIQRPALDPAESFLGSVRYQTANGQSALLGQGTDLAGYAPFPPSLAQAGDLYSYAFQATAEGRIRMLSGTRDGLPGPLSPRLPSAIPPFTVQAGPGATPVLGLAWEAMDPAPEVQQIVLHQPLDGGDLVYWYLYFSKGWIGGGPRFAWTQPDPALVPALPAAAQFRRGRPLTVSMSQSGSRSLPAALEGMLGGFPAAGIRGPAGRPLPGAPGMPLLPFPFRLVTGPAPRQVQAAAGVPEFVYSGRSQTFTP